MPECVDLDSFKVHAPTSVVFVCGGRVVVGSDPPVSLRDAFIKIKHNAPFGRYQIRQAEDIEFAHLNTVYDELVSFESDIAQISELIMLFSESAGSIAELGMFVMDDEIAPRLLAFVDSENFKKDSYIKNGPLHSLTFNHGGSAVCVINLPDIGIEKIEAPQELDYKTFHRVVAEPFEVRLAASREPRTFDRDRNGHLIKLVTGLLQHYGALRNDEIEFLLYWLGINRTPKQIEQLMLCAQLFSWVYIEKRGIHVYYAATTERQALFFTTLSNININRTRWKTQIRDHWKTADVNRFGVIATASKLASR